MKKKKIAIFDIAPTHYRTPIYEKLAKKKEISLVVYFSSNIGTKKQFLNIFKREVKWENDLSGFKHKFLKNYYKDISTAIPSRMLSFETVREIAKNKFDAVIVVTYPPLNHKLAILAAKLTRTPIIFKEEIDLIQKNESAKWKVKEKLLKILFKKIDAFIYGYKKNKEFYIYCSVPKDKLFPFPCAVNNAYFQKQKKSLPSKTSLRKTLKIPKGSLVGVMTNRFSEGKRTIDAIKAFERLENSHLIIIGSGEKEKELKDYIRKNKIKNITMPGFISQSNLGKYLKASDVYMIPSIVDRSPKALQEGMNFGLVPIVSDMVPTIPDLITSKKTGFVHENKRPDRIRVILKKLRDNRALLKERQKNTEKIVKKWNFDKDVKGLMEAIKYVTREK